MWQNKDFTDWSVCHPSHILPVMIYSSCMLNYTSFALLWKALILTVYKIEINYPMYMFSAFAGDTLHLILRVIHLWIFFLTMPQSFRNLDCLVLVCYLFICLFIFVGVWKRKWKSEIQKCIWKVIFFINFLRAIF